MAVIAARGRAVPGLGGQIPGLGIENLSKSIVVSYVTFFGITFGLGRGRGPSYRRKVRPNAYLPGGLPDSKGGGVIAPMTSILRTPLVGDRTGLPRLSLALGPPPRVLKRNKLDQQLEGTQGLRRRRTPRRPGRRREVFPMSQGRGRPLGLAASGPDPRRSPHTSAPPCDGLARPARWAASARQAPG